MSYSRDDIEEAFKFHPPKDDFAVQAHGSVRRLTNASAIWIFENVPDCPERDTAIDKIREAMYWANAAVAIHGAGSN